MLKGDLVNLSILQGLNRDQLDLLEPLVEVCTFPAGSTLFAQGQEATHLYLITRGTIEVRFKPYDGPPLTVSRMGTGDVCGWSSALGRDVYTSSAVATDTSEVYCISGAALHDLCEQHPDAGVVILEKLASAIAKRLENTHAQIMSILSQGMKLEDSCSRKVEKDD